MVDVSYQMMLSTLQTVALVVGISYYIMTLRNQQKSQKHAEETRQAQLFMGFYETYRNREFKKQFNSSISQQPDDYNDWLKKYGPVNNPDAWADWQTVAAYFNGIGVLLKKGFIDISLVEELLVHSVAIAWVRMGPIIKESRNDRETFSQSGGTNIGFYHGFEYLYNELLKRDPQLPL